LRFVRFCGRTRALGRFNNNDWGHTMARKPGTRSAGDFVLFDVLYEDGTQRSNRRVPASALGGLDKDAPAKAIIAQQDREIAEKSGIPPMTIKAVRRSDSKLGFDGEKLQRAPA
jgi:hypothetical protein